MAKEKSLDIDKCTSFKNADVNWVIGEINIILFVAAVGDSPARLNLNYQTRLSEEAGKL